MKKGFLNTNKAKRKLAEITDFPKGDSVDRGKGKAKAQTHTDTVEPCPPLLDLHSVSRACGSLLNYPKDKNRFVFRFWPRDPNGKPILPSDIHGKEAGNGLNLWGATLYDFYFVRRIPSNVHGLTISTGSKLVNVMNALGELEHAKDELAWASREADPREIPAWDPAQAIMIYERRVHAGCDVVRRETKAKPTAEETSQGKPQGGAQKLEPFTDEAIDSSTDVDSDMDTELNMGVANKPSGQPVESKDEVQISPDIPVESPFHPSHYPSPWPFTPLESHYIPFALQRRIPIHLLPKKLYVHDPWRLVHADPDTSDEGIDESWASKPEHTHTYTLSIPQKSKNKAETAEDEAIDTPETVFIPPQETEGPTEQPAIRVFLPKRPPKPTEVPEAHLYLSPKGRLGTGNHSVIYETELELPRSLFCDSTYCKSCLDGQIKVEVDKLKESGEWEQRLNEAAKTYETPGEQVATSANSPSTSSAQISPRHVGFVKVRWEHVPMETADVVAATTFGERPPADAPSQQIARVSDSVINRYIDYEGLIISVHPNIQWQTPSYPETLCDHQAEKYKPVPRTARFRVAAKLSLPDDLHLEREADNYLKFPDHFFQHWTGYNVIPPLLDPTPVGAVVPQFFGYYKPDPPSNSDEDDAYRSPILLLEHCGKPISVDKLTIDDRQECASLLFRFHSAGWLHKSFAERNILRQKQHPTCSPLEEEGECDVPHRHRPHSFRLIDFGRSEEYQHANSRAIEEAIGMKLFGLI